MQITVTGKQVDIGLSLRGHVETSLAPIVERYFGRATEAHVVLSRTRHQFCAELSVHAMRGLDLRTSSEAADAYLAFDSAVERLETRLRRYKRRLRNHRHARDPEPETQPAIDYVLATPSDEADGEVGSEPLVIAELKISIPHLSVSEAVMRLDLADLPALLFRNSAHGNLNLLYRRRDGNLGWVDPELIAQNRGAKDKA